LREGLGQGCGEVVASPSEILLDQSDLTSELAGIALGKPGALSVESGCSLGFLMLGGHCRELVREAGDWLGADIVRWYLPLQVNLLLHF
jgi:hypothetical protein